MCRRNFDLVTCNWNPAQTKIWMFHVKQHCPTAHIVLVPDTKPIPWNWSSGKLNCFADLPELKYPGRFIYMDTDTIVTRDIAEVFDLMDSPVAASSAIPATAPSMSAWAQDPRGRESIDVAFEIFRDHPPIHYSSGFLAIQGSALTPAELGFRWRSAMEYPLLRARFSRHRCYEEIALSYVLATDRIPVWDMPLEIHGNILRRTHFGHTRTPMVIHYHNPRRLRAQHLEHYLETPK